MGVALQEQAHRDVASHIAERKALAPRQMGKMRGQQHGKDDKTQIDDEGRGEDHPHGRLRGQQG
ncbi:hypothetical protein D3C72_2107930 [compost metagenome]